MQNTNLKKENIPQANLKFAWGRVLKILSIFSHAFVLRLSLGFLLVFFLFPVITSAATLSKPANNLGLVAYWSMNEGTSTYVTDFSGNGNIGTTTNMSNPATATSGWGVGKRGNALNFDGNDDYVNAGSGSSVDNLTLAVPATFSFWVKLSSGTNNLILAKDDGNSVNAGWWIENISTTPSDGVVGLRLIVERTTTNLRAGAASPPSNVWTHVVITYNGDLTAANVKIYYNGVLQSLTTSIDGSGTQGSDASETLLMGFNRPVSLGGISATMFNGSLDEVRLYNRALSATEVSALYKTGAVARKVASDLGLLGYWSFNEGTGTVATDFSGNGNNATTSAGTSWTNGKYGKAILFGGEGSGTFVRTNSPIERGISKMTISFWIYADSIPTAVGNGESIVSKWMSSTGDWSMGLSDADNSIMGFGDTNGGGSTATGAHKAGVWEHWVTVYDGTQVGNARIVMYRNNVLQSLSYTGTIGATTIGTAFNVTIGADPSVAPADQFGGKIDEVRIYNRALDSDEVRALYQGSKAIFANMSPVNRITNGLVGYWTFDGKDTDWSKNQTYDRSGNNNTGTMTSMSTSSAPDIGQIGQGLKFDGVNDTVSVGSSNLFPNAGNPMSISAWVWSGAGGCQQAQIVNRTDSGGNNGWDFYCDNGGLIVFDNWGTTDLYKYSAESINGNTWTHVAVSWDGSTSYSNVHTYINGVETTCGTCQNGSVLTDVTGGSAYIGSNHNTQQYWTGMLDEVRIYNRALSAQEIKQLYLMGK